MVHRARASCSCIVLVHSALCSCIVLVHCARALCSCALCSCASCSCIVLVRIVLVHRARAWCMVLVNGARARASCIVRMTRYDGLWVFVYQIGKKPVRAMSVFARSNGAQSPMGGSRRSPNQETTHLKTEFFLHMLYDNACDVDGCRGRAAHYRRTCDRPEGWMHTRSSMLAKVQSNHPKSLHGTSFQSV